jgi:uncharacterized protein (TIGR02996 family)
MPPPGYEPFLRAICADPEDDTVRLVYADWLDENGDPDRAEFIRSQIAHHRNPRDKKAESRARWLFKTHGAKWRAELPRLQTIDWSKFERGFVCRVSIRLGNFSDDLTYAWAVAPITWVQLCHCRPWTLRTLVGLPLFANVRVLEAHAGYADDEALEVLSGNTNARGVEELNLPGDLWATTANGRERIPQVTDRGAVALAGSPVLERLRRLCLPRCHLTAEGWALLRARYPFASAQDWNW